MGIITAVAGGSGGKSEPLFFGYVDPESSNLWQAKNRTNLFCRQC